MSFVHEKNVLSYSQMGLRFIIAIDSNTNIDGRFNKCYTDIINFISLFSAKLMKNNENILLIC